MSKKILTLVVAAAFVFALVGVSSAKAATVAELEALIAQLQAQISALSGGTTVATGDITKDLTIGSRGDQVEILQKYLEDEGYLVMPAGVAYGYFGAMTKTAVAKWQADNGVAPAAGYFGTKSRAMYATLTAGSTSGTGTTGTTPVASLDNTDGSLTAADASYVSSGATFKKGDTQNIYDVKLQATGGKVAVNRVDVKFSERPWLTLNKLTLKDTSGNVIAEKILSSAADVTEITVGTDYRVRFDGLNVVVTPGTDTTLVVSATAMSASDKISKQTVTVSIPAGAIRSINGKGYTETNGTAITAKTFTFSSTGSTADLNTSVSPNSPAKRSVVTSTSVTPDVVLGVFRLKAANQSAEVASLSLLINSSTGVATSTLLSNLRLVDESGNVYGASSLTAGPTFTNMKLQLPKDTWKDITIKADIAASQTLSASTTLDVSTVAGLDVNYNTMTLTNASDVTANDVVFTTGALELTSASVVAGDPIYAYTQGLVTNKNVDFIFTLKNNSNNVLYASTTVAQLVSTSTAGSAGAATVASSTIQSVSVAPSTDANDTSTNYAIQPGSSRTFTLKGLVSKIAGATAYSELKITGINYSGTTITAGTINFGLEALKYGLSM